MQLNLQQLKPMKQSLLDFQQLKHLKQLLKLVTQQQKQLMRLKKPNQQLMNYLDIVKPNQQHLKQPCRQLKWLMMWHWRHYVRLQRQQKPLTQHLRQQYCPL
jgi:hypothetical protein